jgi:hypothetical protein
MAVPAGHRMREIRPRVVVVSDTRYHCATRPCLLFAQLSPPCRELSDSQCSASRSTSSGPGWNEADYRTSYVLRRWSGILDTGTRQIDFLSGYSEGRSNVVQSHVEAHAAAVMRQESRGTGRAGHGLPAGQDPTTAATHAAQARCACRRHGYAVPGTARIRARLRPLLLPRTQSPPAATSKLRRE